jgi:hypothetical protein
MYDHDYWWERACSAEAILKRIINEDESDIGATSDRDWKRRVKILIENYIKELNV